MATRVQTQLLPEAPNLQPTISAGGRYTVQVQQAGKNKWHALADTLSQINPALANYSEAMQTRNKMLMKEGYIDYQSDQKKMEQELATFKAEQEKTKNGIRKLVNQGLLPDDANAVRMIGALKARAEVMVNNDYRAQVMAPEGFNVADPEQHLRSIREEFLKADDFQSNVVKEHALGQMLKVEDEYRKTMQSQREAAAMEQGKMDWLKMGEPYLKQALEGGLDINNEMLKTWANHPAALFKGANAWAFENGIRKMVMDGVLTPAKGDGTPAVSPDEAIEFLHKLRDWDLGGGAKFADGATGNSINSSIVYLQNIKAQQLAKNKATQNTAYQRLLGEATAAMQSELKDTNQVSINTYNNFYSALKEQLPPELWDDIDKDLGARWTSFNNMVDDDDTSKTQAKNLLINSVLKHIANGEDLEGVLDMMNDTKNALVLGSSYSDLSSKVNAARDFKKVVDVPDGAYRTTQNNYEETLTGIDPTKSLQREGWDEATETWFSGLKLEEPIEVAVVVQDGGVGEKTANNIQELFVYQLGEQAFKNTVMQLGNRFTINLRNASIDRFKALESDPDTTPEEARRQLENELSDITPDGLAQKELAKWAIYAKAELKKIAANPKHGFTYKLTE